MLGKEEGIRKRGRANTRWTGSLKETTSLRLQELSRAVEDRTFWRWLIHRVAISRRQLHGALQRQRSTYIVALEYEQLEQLPQEPEIKSKHAAALQMTLHYNSHQP